MGFGPSTEEVLETEAEKMEDQRRENERQARREDKKRQNAQNLAAQAAAANDPVGAFDYTRQSANHGAAKRQYLAEAERIQKQATSMAIERSQVERSRSYARSARAIHYTLSPAQVARFQELMKVHGLDMHRLAMQLESMNMAMEEADSAMNEGDDALSLPSGVEELTAEALFEQLCAAQGLKLKEEAPVVLSPLKRKGAAESSVLKD